MLSRMAIAMEVKESMTRRLALRLVTSRSMMSRLFWMPASFEVERSKTRHRRSSSSRSKSQLKRSMLRRSAFFVSAKHT